MGNPVVHFEVLSAMAPRLQEFYAQAFGWKVDASNPMDYGVVDTMGGRGINGGIGTAPGMPNMVTLYVAVPDHAAALAKAGELGGKTLMPPTEVMPGLTIALFADPAGNALGLVGDTPHEGAEGAAGPSAGEGKPVTWFEICGLDAKPLLDFYSGLFGWSYKTDEQFDYAEVDPGSDGGIPGGIGPAEQPYVTFYVEVDGLEATAERIATLGGKQMMEATDVGTLVVSQFADPEGNRIGVFARK